MLDDRIARQGGSFIVRIWWERNCDDDDAHAWRGWIQHVRTGNQTPFHTMKDLTRFIEHELGILPPAEETAPGLV